MRCPCAEDIAWPGLPDCLTILGSAGHECIGVEPKDSAWWERIRRNENLAWDPEQMQAGKSPAETDPESPRQGWVMLQARELGSCARAGCQAEGGALTHPEVRARQPHHQAACGCCVLCPLAHGLGKASILSLSGQKPGTVVGFQAWWEYIRAWGGDSILYSLTQNLQEMNLRICIFNQPHPRRFLWPGQLCKSWPRPTICWVPFSSKILQRKCLQKPSLPPGEAGRSLQPYPLRFFLISLLEVETLWVNRREFENHWFSPITHFTEKKVEAPKSWCVFARDHRVGSDRATLRVEALRSAFDLKPGVFLN